MTLFYWSPAERASRAFIRGCACRPPPPFPFPLTGGKDGLYVPPDALGVDDVPGLERAQVARDNVRLGAHALLHLARLLVVELQLNAVYDVLAHAHAQHALAVQR